MDMVIATVGASVLSLALTATIYACNIRSHPTSPWRSDMLAMIVLALLTGILPIAVAGTGVLGWSLVSAASLGGAAITLGAIAASAALLVATFLVFRATVRATPRAAVLPPNVTPLTPRPAPVRPTTQGTGRIDRLAS